MAGAKIQAVQQVETEEVVDSVASERKLTRQESLEKELLELILAYPELNNSLEDLKVEHTSELHRDIFDFLKNNTRFKFDDLLKALPNQENYVKILSLKGEQQYADLTVHDKRLEAFTQVARIEEIYKQILKRQLASQLSQAEADGDSKKTKDLLRQYQALLNED